MEIFGFSIRWYPHALQTVNKLVLPSGTRIRLIDVSVFVVTKFEAFSGRGKNYYFFSYDLGDIIAVIDGRNGLIEECRLSAPELKAVRHDIQSARDDGISGSAARTFTGDVAKFKRIKGAKLWALSSTEH